MNRRGFLRGAIAAAAGTTSYFVFGSGLWKPKIPKMWLSSKPLFGRWVEGGRPNVITMNLEVYKRYQELVVDVVAEDTRREMERLKKEEADVEEA